MRELNELELEQVVGGYLGYAGGCAKAGSIVSIKKGNVSSFSDASLLVTPDLIVAGASNTTSAAGEFSLGVSSSASTLAEIAR